MQQLSKVAMDQWNISRELTSVDSDPDPISADVKYLFDVIITCGLHTSLVVFGSVTNILNVIIFSRIGVMDSITISFVALSFTDFGVEFMNTAERVCMIFSLVLAADEREINVDLDALAYTLTWYAKISYDMSVFITVFIAVQKCCCVALPFHFSDVFTPIKSIVINVTIVCGFLVYHLPVMANQDLRWRFDPRTNSSRLVMWVTKERSILLSINDFGRNIYITASQVIVIICLLILVIKLRKSSAFRRTVASGDESTSKEESSKVKFSTRDLNVIKSVTYVAALFVACTIPSVALAYCRQFIPKFDFTGHANLFLVVFRVRNTFIYLCCAVNIFIYYRFNTKFREETKILFRPFLLRVRLRRDQKEAAKGDEGE
ncbi:uncharacterized protein LOC118477223 [Aplysia californica]|uniref:Uncharacterized protein LOC118477223 n=1 Tax=Aplysia californica TaxID=6500 RepID=A0ABM1VNS7_APLCA|nr:uncharacterized protein LOC118477223 [Aplysia californica]